MKNEDSWHGVAVFWNTSWHREDMYQDVGSGNLLALLSSAPSKTKANYRKPVTTNLFSKTRIDSYLSRLCLCDMQL